MSFKNLSTLSESLSGYPEQIIVTGANGYLGRGIVKKLLDCGNEVMANDYKKQYKTEFAQAVESEFGQGYSLKKVEGVVRSWVSDYHIMTQYSALRELSGILKNNGNQYHAAYLFDTKTLETDVYSDEILRSLVRTLGMDPSKVSYTMGYDYLKDHDYFLFESDVDTMEEVMKKDKGIYFYIITSQDLDGLDFDTYAQLCRNNKKIYEIYILSSDDFIELDHFKKHYKDIMIGYPDVKVPETDKTESVRTDIFLKYNLKGFVYIHQTQEKQEEYNIEVLRYK